MVGPEVRLIAPAALYLNAFIVGTVLMGFEMLGSRYLFPYFGGGIGTWAGLISMVLIALTIGYSMGGSIVDRYPSTRIAAIAIIAAAAYLAAIPIMADHTMPMIMNSLGDGPEAVLTASAALLLVPMSLLGTLSPIAIRLLVRTTAESGRVAGFVYGISTIGNVFGVLGTTFFLIPAIGSREITYLFSVILGLCAIMLFSIPYRATHAASDQVSRI
jgi:MFS family permease